MPPIAAFHESRIPARGVQGRSIRAIAIVFGSVSLRAWPLPVERPAFANVLGLLWQVWKPNHSTEAKRATRALKMLQKANEQ
jgi:hypothetical protein